MKIADNYKEIISLWNENYTEMIGTNRRSWDGIIYPFNTGYNFYNAIIQLEDKDWNNAHQLIKKYKKKDLENVAYWKKQYDKEIEKGQNKITFTITYIAPAFYNYYQWVLQLSLIHI